MDTDFSTSTLLRRRIPSLHRREKSNHHSFSLAPRQGRRIHHLPEATASISPRHVAGGVRPNERCSRIQPDVSARDRRIFLRQLHSRAQHAASDRQGRLVLPEELCRKLGLKGEVALVGGRGRFEIWNLQRWKQAHEEETPLTSTWRTSLAYKRADQNAMNALLFERPVWFATGPLMLEEEAHEMEEFTYHRPVLVERSGGAAGAATGCAGRRCNLWWRRPHRSDSENGRRCSGAWIRTRTRSSTPASSWRASAGGVTLRQANFRDADSVLDELGISHDRRRASRSWCLLAPTRKCGARIQLHAQRSARHADGSAARS